MRKQQFKFKLLASVLAPALALSLAGPLPAADKSGMPLGTPAEQAKAATAARDLRASKVIGMKVHNPMDEQLGKIDDLIIDVNNERVAYAVLAFGGTMGVGDKLFAYPLSLFQTAAGKNSQLVLNVDKEKLKEAPGFERKNWPDWNKEASYRADVDRHFGPTVSPKTLPNQRLARASDLIGKNVDDRTGKHAGELEDLVVNLGTAKVHYAILDFDKRWSTDDKLLPLPLHAFAFPDDRRQDLVLSLAKTDLDMTYGFDEKKWPDIGDPAYSTRMDTYLGRVTPPAGRSTGQAGPMRDEPTR
jgi:sporulation protein YlmC with PRC-barrel domain